MRIKPWIIAGFVAVFAIAAYWYFFSNTPARLAKGTTFITSPLAEDGLPNYALAILERQGNGVTTENNAAPLLWRAAGPGRLDSESFAALCDELDVNIADPPSPSFLVAVASDENVDRLARWIAKQDGTLAELGEAAKYPLPAKMLDVAKPYLQAIQTRPWTSEQFPPLADWLTQNDAALNLLVEASRKPRFFSPPSNFLLNANAPIFTWSLEHASQARLAAQSLAARAMHRLAAEQHAAAWEDAFACWKFAQLVGNDREITDFLIGLAIRQVAQRATLAILDSPTLPKELAIQIQADLATLAPALDAVSPIDFYERIMLIDVALRHLSGRLGGIEDQSQVSTQSAIGINLNVALETTNRFYDQLVAALAMNDYQERSAAIQKPYEDLDERAERTIGRRLRSIVSRKVRSENMGDVYLALMAPAMSAFVGAWEKDHADYLLTQVAAALATYRAEHGEYPTSLEALVAGKQLPSLPNDPFADEPFKYERRGDGYLLYSLSHNRIDDGGEDLTLPILAGEWAPESERSVRGLNEGDLVIRLPQPSLQLPSRPADDDVEP